MMCSGEEPAVGRFQGGGVRSRRPVHAPAEIHGPGAGGDGQSVAAEGWREQRLHPTGRGRGAGLHGAALHAHTQHRRSAVRRTQVGALQNAFFGRVSDTNALFFFISFPELLTVTSMRL